jgi:UDP-N-acetylmuramate-alanine ligase
VYYCYAGMAEVFESLQQISHHVHSFTGAHRRLESLGFTNIGESNAQISITVYDDYAHHPLEAVASLQALAQAHTGAELWIVWEPITRSRLEHFLEDFVDVFANAEPGTIIVGPIHVAREADDPDKDQQLLIKLEGRLSTALRKRGKPPRGKVMIAASWPRVNDQLLSCLKERSNAGCGSHIIVVFMGAAKVTHAAHALLENIERCGI